MPAKKTIAQKIANFRIEGECWVWMGCRCVDGYGKVTVREYRETLAHRASFRFYRGDIPAGTELDHLCRNRPCINPDHLEPVTHAVNAARGDYKSNHRNALKTHCLQGHEFAGYNVVMEDGARKCRACRNRRMRERKAALRVGRLRKSIKGERNGRAKLRHENVRTIRHLYFAERRSQQEIANYYGVGQTTISDVLTGRRWRET